MSTNKLGISDRYNLSNLTAVQLRDTYSAIYIGGGQYAVVVSETGRTVGKLTMHPSTAYTATAADGQRLLIEGGQFYHGDRGPQGIAQLVTWPNP